MLASKVRQLYIGNVVTSSHFPPSKCEHVSFAARLAEVVRSSVEFFERTGGWSEKVERTGGFSSVHPDLTSYSPYPQCPGGLKGFITPIDGVESMKAVYHIVALHHKAVHLKSVHHKS
jgi:hypothetical protein